MAFLIAGAIETFIPKMISKYLGQGFWQITLASILGVVMYTLTLVEIPFVRELLVLGMGTGPALAFLLTGPALKLTFNAWCFKSNLLETGIKLCNFDVDFRNY
jgi:hypothetical protein